MALLLAAQLGAQWHSYAHGAARTPAATSPLALAGHGDCSDCLGYAPLLASAGAPAGQPHVTGVSQRARPSTRPVSLPDHTRVLAFRSRAPPR